MNAILNIFNVIFTSILPVLPPIATLISAIIVLRNANFTARIARQNNIVDLVVKFLGEVNPDKIGIGWSTFKAHQYCSDEHKIIEQKLAILLSTKDKTESDVLSTIKQFKDDCDTREKYSALKEKLTEVTHNFTQKETKRFF